MNNLKEFKHYLNHSIIKDPNVPDSSASMTWFVCSTCGILLFLNEDGILFHDESLENFSFLDKKLNITCEEYQIKNLLE